MQIIGKQNRKEDRELINSLVKQCSANDESLEGKAGMKGIIVHGRDRRRSKTGLRVAATIVTGIFRTVLDGEEKDGVVVNGTN